MVNCIIVHGIEFSRRKIPINERHWLPWVRDELIKRGISATNPLMPVPWKPDYDSWKDEFEKQKINEDTILIGHSCGGAFVVRWLGDMRKRIRKLILVAPGKKHKDSPEILNKNMYDFETDRSIRERVEEIVVFISNDEYHRIENAKSYVDELGARLVELKNKGHFLDREMGGKEFPELLREVLENG